MGSHYAGTEEELRTLNTFIKKQLVQATESVRLHRHLAAPRQIRRHPDPVRRKFITNNFYYCTALYWRYFARKQQTILPRV